MMTDQAMPDRALRPAVINGLRGRCPNCGEGHLFSGYLSVNRSCAHCGEALHHHRADDGPAYLTILIVGHIMAPMMLVIYSRFQPEPLVMFAGFASGVVILSLSLLPRLKGLIVAVQWAKRMHGFGAEA